MHMELGVTSEKRSPRVIVSLTSFPQRMEEIHYCLYSLLDQTLKPDEVVLWLAKEQFPNGDTDIPQEVLDLKEKGLTIRWCRNLHSYKKLVPSLLEFPEDIIVTADDNVYYEQDWLEQLCREHLEHPEYIVCNRAHTIKLGRDKNILPFRRWKKISKSKEASFRNMQIATGGVLYPPKSLHKDATNAELFGELAPTTDDIWFWAMAVLNDTKVKVIKNNVTRLRYLSPERKRGLMGIFTLFNKNKKCGNDLQLEKVMEHYPDIAEKLVL